MISNVFRNLFSRPATRPFPASAREPAPDARGSVDFNIESCVFCGACALRCPTEAIEVNRQERTLEFDLFRCVGCACCAEACKHGCVQMRAAYSGPTFQKPEMRFQGVPIVKAEDAER